MLSQFRRPALVASSLLALALPALHAAYAQARPPAKPKPGAKPAAAKPAVKPAVSFHRQVRPIFQARCEGCHQAAKPSGGYVMTQFDRLLAGGDSKKTSVVPGKPESSHLLALVTPTGGKAAMPVGGKPLTPAELATVRQWIVEGAKNDSPAAAQVKYDAAHPPVYTRPPVVTSMDYSPDGNMLAVSGFHEVLLLSPDGKERLARLIGMAERIESVRFSPDGKRLAVTGGRPGRSGELQVWDVAERKLLLSQAVTSDTIYGASWSPDGTKIAFGCPDNTVRAVDASTGQQVLQQGSHSDWVLDTTFSKDGSHLVSVGRDQTVKLTEVVTQRFVDNITSITPGALRGGIGGVARHPERDEVVVGGADGTPRVYRVFRQTVRVIGDDSNLIREMPALKGRIFSVAVSRDGKRLAAGSSLDGAGEIGIYSYEFDPALSDGLKAILSKVASTRTPEERAQVDAYHKAGVKQIAKVPVTGSGVYAVAFSPDGKSLAAAGADGSIRVLEVESGAVRMTFSPVELSKAAPKVLAGSGGASQEAAVKAETLPAGTKLVALEVQPPALKLDSREAYSQLLVTGKLASGETLDVTRAVQQTLSAPVIRLSRGGLARPAAEGTATLKLTAGGKMAVVPVSVSGLKASAPVDYIRDVQPVLSRLGCNAGTCHGAQAGKNGFKLSLRGYDPLFDIRALTDDHAARRVNVASPDDSLMLLKARGEVPHVGGKLLSPGDPYYAPIRAWIADGAKLSLSTPRVTGIRIQAQNPVVQKLGGKQQMRVLATYADGKVRDVTREAFIESGNGEVATADRGGLLTALRRGEASVLARFEGAYAATTLTVMGDRTGFAWKQPPAYNRVDELAAAKWKRMKIEPAGLCTDAEFIRRAYLDLTGLPPTADETRAFLADPAESRAKRDALVDRLVGSKEYVEHWSNKWADLLQVNRKFLGVEGSVAFRKWIREQVEKNTPYDEFARQIITASGSNRENPAASYWKILRDPDAAMENTTHLFLGVRFNCNKCHDHPFERWTQDQYYNLAAYFAQVDLKRDPASGGAQIGGSAVESGKPLYEIVADKKEGEITHARTGETAAPKFPYSWAQMNLAGETRRAKLADWLTDEENQYFAKSYVNRLWGYLFGVGIIEPIDDIRAGNPPTNPELLDYLTQEFIKSDFDVRAMLKLIAKSRTYQLSVATNKWNEDDKINYSHATARRLPAEVLYDAVHRATGTPSRIPGLPPGTRAAELPDSGVELESGFFGTFGRPARESACECERTTGLQLGPVMALISGPTIATAVGDPQNAIAKLVAEEKDDRKVVSELFLRILNRPPTEAEIKAALDTAKSITEDHQKLVAALKAREAEVKPIREKQEADRLKAIAEAKADLAVYEKELAPVLAQKEREKAERTAKLEADLKAYEATLPGKLAEWEKRQNAGIQWTRLDPERLAGPNGTKLEKLPDGSVFVTGEQAKGAYTFTARTDLKNITAIRLEAIVDDRLPQRGPGRAPDGNFVLTEFELTAAPANDPNGAKKIALNAPLADFTQNGFDIRQAVDGNPNGNGGWAASPVLGIPHWATFQTAEAVGGEGGTVLSFRLVHNFQAPQYGLGRFRISVATQKEPVGLSLPDDLAEIVRTPVAERRPEQAAYLLKYFTTLDAGYMQRATALAQSRAPLPEDPKLTTLKAELALAEKAVPDDPRLVQLRSDVAQSEQQIGNPRLTAAQDLAWALINSPSFLFNH